MERPRLRISNLLFLIPSAVFLAVIVNGFLHAGVRPTDMLKYHVTSRVLEVRTVKGLAADIDITSMDKKPRLSIELWTSKRDAGRSLSLWLVDSFGKRKPLPLAPIKFDEDGHRTLDRDLPDGALQRYDRVVGKAGRRTVLVVPLS